MGGLELQTRFLERETATRAWEWVTYVREAACRILRYLLKVLLSL